MVKRFVLAALGLAIAGSVLLPATHAFAQAPPTPQCPAGTTFNGATGTCETPVCAAGEVFDAASGFCTTPLPLLGLCAFPAVPIPGPGGALVCGTPAVCAAGLTGPTPGGLCTAAAVLFCP